MPRCGRQPSATTRGVRAMTDDTVLDTRIDEPPMTADEVDVALFALDRSRAQFAWKVGGLDTAGLNPATTAVDDDPG